MAYYHIRIGTENYVSEELARCIYKVGFAGLQRVDKIDVLGHIVYGPLSARKITESIDAGIVVRQDLSDVMSDFCEVSDDCVRLKHGGIKKEDTLEFLGVQFVQLRKVPMPYAHLYRMRSELPTLMVCGKYYVALDRVLRGKKVYLSQK